MTRRDAAWRVWRLLVLGAVVVVAIINVVATVRRVPPPPRSTVTEPPDVVLRYEARFAPVRRALAERGVHGTVGFIGGEPKRPGAEPDAMLDYLLSQFALAPWVLDRNFAARAWVVAHPRAGKMPMEAGPEFQLVQDFGDGLVLLARPATP